MIWLPVHSGIHAQKEETSGGTGSPLADLLLVLLLELLCEGKDFLRPIALSR